MKQSIINYLDNIKEELFSLCANLFHLVGEPLQEIQKLLEEQGFSTTLEPSLLKGEIHGGKGPTLGFFSGYPTPSQNEIGRWKLSLAQSISLGAVLGISNVIEELEGGIVIYCYPCDQESALNESGFEKIHGGFLLKVGKRTCESSGNIPGFINNSTLNRLFCHNLKEAGIIEIHGARENIVTPPAGRLSHLIPCTSPIIGILDITPEEDIQHLRRGQPSPADKKVILRGSHAAAFTALDIISKRDLFREMIQEFQESIEKVRE